MLPFWGSKQGFPGLFLGSAALVLLSLKAIFGLVHPGCWHPSLSAEMSRSKAMPCEDTILVKVTTKHKTLSLDPPPLGMCPARGSAVAHTHAPTSTVQRRYEQWGTREGGERRKERITSAAIFSSRWVFPFPKLYLYSPAPPPFPVLNTPALESTIPLEAGGCGGILTPLGSVCPWAHSAKGELASHTITHPHPPCWVWSHLSCWMTWQPRDTSCNPRGCRQVSYQLQQAKEDQPAALLRREDGHPPPRYRHRGFIH